MAAAVAALGCATEAKRAARPPGVATRHAPQLGMAGLAEVLARASANPEASTAANAFDPPARLRLPATLQAGERVPLLLVLHGFGVSSSLLIAKAGLNAIADEKRFAYLAPEGTRDALGRPFWNAGKSCCDLDHTGVDDVKRLRDLLDANLGNAAVDPKRVFIIGYSNGGFMAQRLACDVGNHIAGVISVAGAAPSSEVSCTQASSLAVLEIHGDADPIVHYAGGTVFDRTDVEAHPSATATVAFWAQQLSCTLGLRDAEPIDIEPHLEGRETTVHRYDGCRGWVELWKVQGGGHYVALQPPALAAIWGFVQAHPKGGQ